MHKILLLLSLLLVPLISFGEEKKEVKDKKEKAEKPKEGADKKEKKEEKFRIDLGFGFSQKVIEVKDGETVQGELRSDLKAVPYVAFKSPFTKFSKKSRFGYKFEITYSTWEVNKQQSLSASATAGQDLEDLGTSAKGHTFYAMPVISYEIFNEKDKTIPGILEGGLGAGIGYIDVKGNIKLTEQTGQPTREFAIKKFSFAFLFILNWHYKNLTIGSHVGGPITKEGGLTYGFFEITPRISYSFQF